MPEVTSLEHRAGVRVDRIDSVVLGNDIDHVMPPVVDLDIINQQWLGVDLVVECDGLQPTEGNLADRNCGVRIRS